MDSGRISAKHLLPIKSFHYGPLKFDVERANVTLGRLTCQGALQIPENPTSCSTLKLQGLVQNGIYTLQGQNEDPRLAYCDMSEQGYFSDLETPIGTLETFSDSGRVMFSVSKRSTSGIGVIIFDEVIQDTANGYDANTGVFKVPTSGVYDFTFSAHNDCRDPYVFLFKDGVKEAIIYEWNDGDAGGCSMTGGSTWTMNLKKDEEITLQVTAGSLLGGLEQSITFSGYLRQET